MTELTLVELICENLGKANLDFMASPMPEDDPQEFYKSHALKIAELKGAVSSVTDLHDKIYEIFMRKQEFFVSSDVSYALSKHYQEQHGMFDPAKNTEEREKIIKEYQREVERSAKHTRPGYAGLKVQYLPVAENLFPHLK